LIKVAVTGHRILAEPDKIIAGIDEALSKIGATYRDEPVTLYSSLAEGADRLVARRVLELPRSSLIAVLPLPIHDYINDFGVESSRAEFQSLLNRADEVVELEPRKSREDAYEAAGNYALDHADILIAVWDGRPSQGQGGTGDIVERARARRMPIAWVHAGNRRPGTSEPTSLGEEQGRLSCEEFPTAAD
jgi:hypothetical protein